MSQFSVLLLLIASLFSGLLAARPIVNTVIANGKEWSQVDIFVDLSWDEINAVCPQGVCGEGTLNGYEMNGWRWATRDEFLALIQSYGYNGGAYEGTEYYSSWAPAFFAAGFRQTNKKMLGHRLSAYLSTELPPDPDYRQDGTQVYFPNLNDVNEEAHLALFGELHSKDSAFIQFGPFKGAEYDTGALFYYPSLTDPGAGQVTVSPPSGALVSDQEFDLVVIVDASDAVINASIAFDGIDVAKYLAPCWQVGARPSGGFSYRCPGIGAKNLGVGRHHFDIRLYFADGSSTADSVIWTVSDATTSALITDTVTVNGREWAQVDLFIGLGWPEIKQVCPTPVCGPGTLNGYYMEGWTWASEDDLYALSDYYLGAGVLAEGKGNGLYSEFYSQADSAWAPWFFNDGWRRTRTRQRDGYFSLDDCNGCNAVIGLTRELQQFSANYRDTFNRTFTVFDAASPLESDHIGFGDGYLEDGLGHPLAPRELGAWFYRDTPGAPLAEAPGSLIISPGSGRFVTSQHFDLTVRLESSQTITGARLTYNGADVGASLASCWQVKPLAPVGNAFTCPDIRLGSVGLHTFGVSVELANGDTLTDSVTWEVVATAE